MGQVQQQITLITTVKKLDVSPTGGGVVLEISPTTQRFPPFVVLLMIDAVNGNYIRDGQIVGTVNPVIFTGPGQNALALVIADVDAMTTAGVFNL